MSVSILQVFKGSTHTSGGSISQVCTGLTAGSRLLCWVTGSGVDTFSFADDVNGSWGSALDTVLAASGFLMAQATLVSTAAGTVTVTVTFDFAPGADAAIWVAEVGGGTSLDGHNGVTQATPGSGANGLQTSFSSTAGQTGMLIAWFTNSANNDTVGTGFTLKQGDIDGFLEFKAVTSTSTQTVSATDTGGPSNTGAFGVFISGSAPAAPSWYDDNTLCMAPQRVRSTYQARSLTATQLPTDWLLPPMSAQNKKMMEWADPFRIHTPWRNRSEPKADNERYPVDALQAVQNKKMFTWADPLRIPWANRTHTPSPWNQYEVVDARQAVTNTKMFTWADPTYRPWSYSARTPPDLTPWSLPVLTVVPPSLQTFLDDFSLRPIRPQVIWDSTPWLSVPLIPPLVLASTFQDDPPDPPPPVYRRAADLPWALPPRPIFGSFWQDDVPDIPPPTYRRVAEVRPDGAVVKPALADPWPPPPVRLFSPRPFTDAWSGASKTAVASYFEGELPHSLPLRYWPGGEPAWLARPLVPIATWYQDTPTLPQPLVYWRASEGPWTAPPKSATASWFEAELPRKTVMPMTSVRPDSWQAPALATLRAWFVDQFQHPPRSVVRLQAVDHWALKTPAAVVLTKSLPDPFLPAAKWTVTRAIPEGWFGTRKTAIAALFEDLPRAPQPPKFQRAGEPVWIAKVLAALATTFEDRPTLPQPIVYHRAAEPPWSASRRAAQFPWFEAATPQPAARRAAPAAEAITLGSRPVGALVDTSWMQRPAWVSPWPALEAMVLGAAERVRALDDSIPRPSTGYVVTLALGDALVLSLRPAAFVDDWIAPRPSAPRSRAWSVTDIWDRLAAILYAAWAIEPMGAGALSLLTARALEAVFLAPGGTGAAMPTTAILSPMSDFKIVAGDRLPVIQATLIGADGSTPIDLTTAVSILLAMQIADQSAPAITGPCTVVGDPTRGVVQYAWQAGDTAAPGDYDVEWVIQFPGALPMTVPSGDPKRIRIRAHI